MKINQKIKTILTLAAFAGLMVSANAAVYSFNMGNGAPAVSGDVPGANNPNGLQITGTVGAWADIWDNNLSNTNNGATFTFASAGFGATVGDARGNNVGSDALRMGFSTFTSNVTWTITGLTPNGSYDMIWYNKRGAPNSPDGRAPNSGVDGFDAGNGIGAAGLRDLDLDQNFIGVQANGSGTISGTWFVAGGNEGLTAVAGVQIVDAVPEPTTTALLGLGGLALILRRRK